MIFRIFLCLLALISARAGATPHILVIVADDWSWPHASILGDPSALTPNFDRIAREGVLFENAFVSAPSCTPSRFAIVSGQYHWRLGEGAHLGGSLAAPVPVYPELLEKAGYVTGFCQKGVAPSQHKETGRDPLGKSHRNFDEFLQKRPPGKSFCFWYGAAEPHRPFDWEASQTAAAIDLTTIPVPPFLPDTETVRTDLGDYYLKVRQLDQNVGQLLEQLEKAGELESTLIVVTSDNGMAFPRAKATLYDSGVRVPLAMRWGNKIPSGQRVDALVSLCDLAPTFLELCGLPIPPEMTGRSLKPLIFAESAESREFVLTGRERHVYPHPARAIRTRDFLYIRNFAPENWPTGLAPGNEPVYDFAKTPWPTPPGSFSFNIDPGPSKQWMRQNESPQNSQAFGPRPAEELYELKHDPHALVNLLAELKPPDSATENRNRLSDQLTRELRASGDPRFILPGHATFEIHRWTIHMSDELWAQHAEATRRMLPYLEIQLGRVAAVVPQPALARLREIPIWINPPYPGRRGTAEYHPNRKWLEDNGRNPKMARAVEITNVDIFPFENRRMPYLMLHELAHGFHDRYLPDGYSNAEIRGLYERARDSGDYDSVARFNGRQTVTDKAYAMSNPMEYFAESSEAFFGKNDFFPFHREELKKHDPAMETLLQKLWGAK